MPSGIHSTDEVSLTIRFTKQLTLGHSAADFIKQPYLTQYFCISCLTTVVAAVYDRYQLCNMHGIALQTFQPKSDRLYVMKNIKCMIC